MHFNSDGTTEFLGKMYVFLLIYEKVLSKFQITGFRFS